MCWPYADGERGAAGDDRILQPNDAGVEHGGGFLRPCPSAYDTCDGTVARGPLQVQQTVTVGPVPELPSRHVGARRTSRLPFHEMSALCVVHAASVPSVDAPPHVREGGNAGTSPCPAPSTMPSGSPEERAGSQAIRATALRKRVCEPVLELPQRASAIVRTMGRTSPVPCSPLPWPPDEPFEDPFQVGLDDAGTGDLDGQCDMTVHDPRNCHFL